MANLTLSVDDELLSRARVRAAQLGTSVNAVLREYLGTWAGQDDRREQAIRSLLRRSARARSGRGDRTWSRDDVHAR